jgi:hypothetical protein
MTANQPRSTDASRFSIFGFGTFLVVAALFLFVSAKAGTRAVGVSMILSALIQMREGRIAYGWKGRPPSGYITGLLATILNGVFVAIGFAVAIWPEVAMGVLGWDRLDNS